jgi:hypothetical protein
MCGMQACEILQQRRLPNFKLPSSLVIKRLAGKELPICMKRRYSDSRQKERIVQSAFLCCLKVKREEVKHT